MTSHYLTDYLPTQDLASINPSKIPAIYPLHARTECFPNSFSPYCILQWNNLDSLTRNLSYIDTFKRAIFDFIRPVPTTTFKPNSLSGFDFLTRLRVASVIYVNTNLDTSFWILLIPFLTVTLI